MEELDTDGAAEYFDSALSVDENFERAKKGNKIASRLDGFFRHNNPSAIPDSFAGLLNAIGIGMVRSGDINGGIDLYTAALGYLSSKRDRALVCFNLGLGNFRKASYEEAEQWLNRSLNLDPEHEKSQNYMKKTQKALHGVDGEEHGEDTHDTTFADESLASVG